MAESRSRWSTNGALAELFAISIRFSKEALFDAEKGIKFATAPSSAQVGGLAALNDAES